MCPETSRTTRNSLLIQANRLPEAIDEGMRLWLCQSEMAEGARPLEGVAELEKADMPVWRGSSADHNCYPPDVTSDLTAPFDALD